MDEVESDCADDMEGSINVCCNIEMAAADSTSFDEELHEIQDSDLDSIEEQTEYTSTSSEVVLGMKFASLKKLKDLVTEQAVLGGYNVKFFKNEKTRLTAKCRDESCQWKLHASKMHHEASFKIKTYDNVHTCLRSVENKLITAKWIANKYKERFRSQPNWKIKSIIETMRGEYNVDVNPSMCFRARRMAKQLNDGCGHVQYKQLWSYAEEIRRTNPGSTVNIKVEGGIFERAYMCFYAWKQGLLTGGRPVICLDGCHLKGQCPGHLLTAVGVDGNDGIYPVAVAVVESECINSWDWFLEILISDLGIEGGAGWTFISDQQKGLTDSLERRVPQAETRFCVRHLYANFKKQFRGMTYKDYMMKASRATTIYDFDEAMRNLRDYDVVAYQYLRKLKPEFWSKHAFSHVSKCDMTLNNLSESFNALILPARDKPIITMLETIRLLLMTRIAQRHRTMEEGDDLLCPRIVKKLRKLMTQAHNWSPIAAGRDRFEVSTDPNNRYIVDLPTHTCSCSVWGLTGIPCVHAVACMLRMKRDVTLFVDRYYHRETYLTIYSNSMQPINAPKRWPSTSMSDILPPTVRRRPGRPKKKRIRDTDEPRSRTSVSRKGNRLVTRCRSCHETGHNARTCIRSREMVLVGSSSSVLHSQTDSSGEGRGCGRGRGRGRSTENIRFMGFNVPSQGSSFDDGRRC